MSAGKRRFHKALLKHLNEETISEIMKEIQDPGSEEHDTKAVRRISKITSKIRESERQTDAALKYAESLKKEIISYFSKTDQKKLRTKRDKKIISSNLVAPKIDKRTKKNLYKSAVRNILKKDKTARKEFDKMTKSELLEVLNKNGIIDKESKAPTKILKDLYHLFLLTEVNISK